MHLYAYLSSYLIKYTWLLREIIWYRTVKCMATKWQYKDMRQRNKLTHTGLSSHLDNHSWSGRSPTAERMSRSHTCDVLTNIWLSLAAECYRYHTMFEVLLPFPLLSSNHKTHSYFFFSEFRTISELFNSKSIVKLRCETSKFKMLQLNLLEEK